MPDHGSRRAYRKCGMEDKIKRLARFQSGPPVEITLTLLNSIANFYNPEIDKAAANELWVLTIIGIHSVALTITEGIFDKRGVDGFRFYLENFVDGKDSGLDFSQITPEIHNMRNVVAHQWLSSSMYDFALDTRISKGWDRFGTDVHLNPKLFYEAFKAGFGPRGRIWKYERLLTVADHRAAKDRPFEEVHHPVSEVPDNCSLPSIQVKTLGGPSSPPRSLLASW